MVNEETHEKTPNFDERTNENENHEVGSGTWRKRKGAFCSFENRQDALEGPEVD
jgi:hypothetical protein